VSAELMRDEGLEMVERQQATKPRKPRVPLAQRMKEACDAAYLRGYDAALRQKSAWPGAIAALVLAAAAFITGASIY
jgi:hypothetical protein